MSGAVLMFKQEHRICNFCGIILRGNRADLPECPECGNPNKIVIDNNFREKYKKSDKGIGLMIRGEEYHKREASSDILNWYKQPVKRNKKGRVIRPK